MVRNWVCVQREGCFWVVLTGNNWFVTRHISVCQFTPCMLYPCSAEQWNAVFAPNYSVWRQAFIADIVNSRTQECTLLELGVNNRHQQWNHVTMKHFSLPLPCIHMLKYEIITRMPNGWNQALSPPPCTSSGLGTRLWWAMTPNTHHGLFCAYFHV